MKTRLFAAIAAVGLATICSVQAYGTANNDEQALINAGFKVKPATTAAQREQLQRLPDHQIATVNQNGTYYYVYADRSTGRLYCGTDLAYRNFKRYLETKRDLHEGSLSYEKKPERITIRTIHDWSPFDQW